MQSLRCAKIAKNVWVGFLIVCIACNVLWVASYGVAVNSLHIPSRYPAQNDKEKALADALEKWQADWEATNGENENWSH